MSGAVSAIGKVFSSVAGGISTAVGSAVSGVGAIVGTAASAGASLFSGGGSSLLSSLTGGGGGILGSLLNGAVNVVSQGVGGIINTGSQLLGGLGEATSSGLGGGMAAGASAVGAEAPSFLSKAGSFLGSEQGAGLIGGLGKGLMEYEKMEQDAKERQKDRDYLLGKEMRIRNSYNVDPASLPNGASAGPGDPTQRPTPATQYGRDFDMVYDPDLGRIVRQQR
jgi:hypothetical protein